MYKPLFLLLLSPFFSLGEVVKSSRSQAEFKVSDVVSLVDGDEEDRFLIKIFVGKKPITDIYTEGLKVKTFSPIHNNKFIAVLVLSDKDVKGDMIAIYKLDNDMNLNEVIDIVVVKKNNEKLKVSFLDDENWKIFTQNR
ncbi:MAG: hypothetical protein ACSHYF_16110 [Verrucomicrobiaceae bacterium]